MSTQQFANHTRMHPFFHYFIVPVSLVGLIAGLLHTFLSEGPNRFTQGLIALAFLLLLCIAGLARIYSLKVQDRIIRNEENLRHFMLTGKPLDPQLHLRQIIALRFAADAEFAELAKRAVAENLSEKDIKAQIKTWRADHHRV